MRLTRAQAKALGIDVGAAVRKEIARRAVPELLPPREAGSPGPWTLELPGWNPPTVNALMHCHWSHKALLKRCARDRIALACIVAGVPRATGKRRVAIEVTVTNRSHQPDADNVPKAVLDALKHAGAIVDDSAAWCELAPVVVGCGVKGTRIVVEEVADGC